MKIAFLAYLEGFGGAEKQIIMLANAMAERNHDVYLISISLNNCMYSVNEKVQRVYLSERVRGPLKHITRYQDLKKCLTKIKPDVSVSFWGESAYLTSLMKKNNIGKVIYSERGDPGDKEYSGIIGFIRDVTLPRIDGFVFQSHGARDFFGQKVKNRSIIISNPVFINQNRYPIPQNREKKIVTVGRLHQQKNHKLLIKAFEKASPKFPEYVLEIFGDGNLKEELENEITRRNLKERVFLRGTSSNIYDLINSASLFVLSSDYEGVPNTLLEAMALGLPCISTDCRPGGAREVITDGKNGILVPVGDADKMAEAMESVLLDGNISSKLGEEARGCMKKYTPQVIYSQWESFFSQIKNGDIR